jgi:putative addiction module component (TIGR02574 family)
MESRGRIESMSQPVEKVLQDALELSKDERLEVAYQLLRSVRNRPGGADEEPLRETIARRVADLVEGRVKAIPGDEAMAWLRERQAERRQK